MRLRLRLSVALLGVGLVASAAGAALGGGPASYAQAASRSPQKRPTTTTVATTTTTVATTTTTVATTTTTAATSTTTASTTTASTTATSTTTAPIEPAAAAAPSAAANCLAEASRVVRVTGPQPAQYRNTSVGSGTGIDARGASWTAVGDWPVHLAGGSDACWLGGSIEGTFSDDTTWATLHGTGAFNLFMAGTTVEAIRVHNYGDGLRMLDNASDFVIRGAHLSFIRDDCIENDRLHGGLVEDTLLDGCYVAFSARPSSNDALSDGRDQVWSIRGSLIRLQPMPTVYSGPAPGHGGFFKWDHTGRAPKLSLHDNIFRADQDSNHTTMGIPDGALADCSNNIMVWLGPGEYPDPLPSCFQITTDRRVWDDAVSRWLDGHTTG